MFALFIVLNQPEYLSEILYEIRKLGIRGATIIDSMGASAMSKDIYNMPVVGGLVKSIDGDTKFNKTIFSVIEREEQVDLLMRRVEKIIGGNMKEPNKGIMFVLPVTHIRGGELHRHIVSRENKKYIEEEISNEYY